jgi:hypothetical protein
MVAFEFISTYQIEGASKEINPQGIVKGNLFVLRKMVG